MRDIEILLPPHCKSDSVPQAIDDALAINGLQVTMRDTLKKYPGCTHWHAKSGRETGTLEVTFRPQQRRAWFTVQSGRNAPWIDEKLRLVAVTFQQKLHDSVQRMGEEL